MSPEQPEPKTAAAAATPTDEAPELVVAPAQDEDEGEDKGKDKDKEEEQQPEKKRLVKLIRKLIIKKDGSKRFSGFFAPKAASPAVMEEGPKNEEAKEKRSPYEDLEGVVRIPKLKLFEERAQTLGQRFGLEINVSEWQSTEGTALRIEKPIRMRVRRTCHECNATFGKDRECPNCKHLRCSRCIRSPPRKTEAERAATRTRATTHFKDQVEKRDTYIIPDYDCDNKKLPPLTRPARCHQQDLIRKKPRQRIRRNCHECSALFRGSSKECQECGHIRCTDCPRDPPKPDKYPYGYPGDVFGPNSIPYHQCHACKTVFDGGVPDDTPCKSCGHRKCQSCPRMKPRKVEPALDPMIRASLQSKLEDLQVSADD